MQGLFFEVGVDFAIALEEVDGFHIASQVKQQSSGDVLKDREGRDASFSCEFL